MIKNRRNCASIMAILGISLASSSISFSQTVAAQDTSGSSETSRFYFNIGVKRYKEEKWDEAEKAFEAVLRADHLHKQANFYLAHINSKQGEDENVIKYVKAYHGFQESYVNEDCIALVASSDLGLVELIESVNSGALSQNHSALSLHKPVNSSRKTMRAMWIFWMMNNDMCYHLLSIPNEESLKILFEQDFS